MAAKKRNRASSRAHTVCPQCQFKVHGDRGLKMHLQQVHGITAKPMAPSERLDRLMGRAQ